jgi:hypothetical protein
MAGELQPELGNLNVFLLLTGRGEHAGPNRRKPHGPSPVHVPGVNRANSSSTTASHDERIDLTKVGTGC